MSEDVAPIFRDLGKDIKDLFEKDFPESMVEVETETTVKSADSSSDKSPSLKIKAVATKKSDGVSASLDGPSIDFPWRGLNFKFSGNTAKNLLSVEGSLKPVKGLKVGLTTESEGNNRRVKGSVEYKHKRATFSSLFTYPFGKPPLINGSGVVRHEDFSFGSEVECELGEEFKVKKHNYKALYSSRRDFTIGLYFTNERPKTNTENRNWDSKVGLTFWNRPQENVQVAVDISQSPYNLGKSAPVINLVGRYEFDKNSRVKAKINTNDCRLGLSYLHKMNPFATVTFGADLNLRELGSDSNHKFGCKLTLNLNP